MFNYQWKWSLFWGSEAYTTSIISLNYESKVGYEIKYFFRMEKRIHSKSQIYKTDKHCKHYKCRIMTISLLDKSWCTARMFSSSHFLIYFALEDFPKDQRLLHQCHRLLPIFYPFTGDSLLEWWNRWPLRAMTPSELVGWAVSLFLEIIPATCKFI